MGCTCFSNFPYFLGLQALRPTIAGSRCSRRSATASHSIADATGELRGGVIAMCLGLEEKERGEGNKELPALLRNSCVTSVVHLLVRCEAAKPCLSACQMCDRYTVNL